MEADACNSRPRVKMINTGQSSKNSKGNRVDRQHPSISSPRKLSEISQGINGSHKVMAFSRRNQGIEETLRPEAAVSNLIAKLSHNKIVIRYGSINSSSLLLFIKMINIFIYIVWSNDLDTAACRFKSMSKTQTLIYVSEQQLF